MHGIKLKNFKIEQNQNLFLIAGPCVIENFDLCFEVASFLKELCSNLKIPFIFKASYDKANRSSIKSFRGPGIIKGLKILDKIKDKLDIPIISDVHTIDEIDMAKDVLDIIQIPAFLCRQTDLIYSVALTQKIVNIKKGQFLSPHEMKNIIEKVESANNNKIILTERGTSFGYNNLVVDFRSIAIMKESKYPIVFDATHSVQYPGSQNGQTGGNRDFAPVLAKAAVAAGADGIFLETHPEPDKALCDSANCINTNSVESLLKTLLKIKKCV